MSWKYTSCYVEEMTLNSTFMGKLWLILLVLYRILVMSIAGKNIFSESLSQLVCNSTYPGCDFVCYTSHIPFSHFHFWIIQMIVINTPNIVYLAFARHKIEGMGKTRQERLDGLRSIKLIGLMKFYVGQLVARAILESSLLVGQFFLYGLRVPDTYMCTSSPCKNTECYVMRAMERNVILWISYVVSIFSLILTVVEISQLSVCLSV